MKRAHSLKLLSEVRDFQIVDCDGRNCGICDDLEFEGGPGEALTVRALLVGPGAYARRLPKWAARLVEKIAGKRVVRVPWQSVEKISGRIFLSVTGEAAGLRQVENRLIDKFKRVPFA